MRKLVLTLVAVLAVVVVTTVPASAMKWDAHDDPTLQVWAGKVPRAWGVARAIALWNQDRVPGQPRLVPTSRPDLAQITVRLVDKPHGSFVGQAWRYRRSGGEIDHVRIDLNVPVANRAKYRPYNTQLKHDTTLHEFGHALGLEHNHNRHSIMSATQAWWHGGRIGAVDVRHLRAKY
jgi:hypothetical protein